MTENTTTGRGSAEELLWQNREGIEDVLGEDLPFFNENKEGQYEAKYGEAGGDKYNRISI